MSRIVDRIGGFRRYLPTAGIGLVGVGLVYWPGGIGTDSQQQFFIVLGAAMAVTAIGWLILTLDRQISDDPRYQRPAYTENEDSDPEE